MNMHAVKLFENSAPPHIVRLADKTRSAWLNPLILTPAGNIAQLAAGARPLVEDAPAGIRSGKASGASVLALRTTEADPLLSAAGANWIVNDLASVQLTPLGGNHYLGFSLLQ